MGGYLFSLSGVVGGVGRSVFCAFVGLIFSARFQVGLRWRGILWYGSFTSGIRYWVVVRAGFGGLRNVCIVRTSVGKVVRLDPRGVCGLVMSCMSCASCGFSCPVTLYRRSIRERVSVVF